MSIETMRKLWLGLKISEMILSLLLFMVASRFLQEPIFIEKLCPCCPRS